MKSEWLRSLMSKINVILSTHDIPFPSWTIIPNQLPKDGELGVADNGSMWLN